MAIKLDSPGPSRRRHRRSRQPPMSEINVTPFVDVMLVLLIVFMVAAPLLTVGVEVNLPKTAAEALPSESEEPLTVTLTADGTSYPSCFSLTVKHQEYVSRFSISFSCLSSFVFTSYIYAETGTG